MSLDFPAGKFTHKNESFTCENCAGLVPPLATGCRNHCPFCLFSKHVDIMPGDRASSCHGLMRPVAYELSGKKGLVLTFECQRCQAKTRNKAAFEDRQQADDYELILALSGVNHASSFPPR